MNRSREIKIWTGVGLLLGETESHWAQNSFALTAKGFPVAPFDNRACQWCIDGAYVKIAVENDFHFTQERPVSNMQKQVMDKIHHRLLYNADGLEIWQRDVGHIIQANNRDSLPALTTASYNDLYDYEACIHLIGRILNYYQNDYYHKSLRHLRGL